MLKHLIPAFIAVLLLLSVGMVQASPTLPGSNFAPEWTTSGEPQKFEKGHLFEYIDGGAELYEEFGAVQLLVQIYKNGNEEIELLVYQMESPESALGIYLMITGKEKPLAEIKARNSSGSSQIFAVKGDCFLQITSLTGSTTSQPVMIQLANMTTAGIADGNSVTLFSLLPRDSLVSGSERLFRGPLALNQIIRLSKDDIFNLNGIIFGVSANYNHRDKSFVTRFMIPYLDEKTAGSVFENLEKNIVSPFRKIKTTTRTVSFKNKEGDILTITIKGKTLDVIYRVEAQPAQLSK